MDLFGAPNQVYSTFSGTLLAPIGHDSEGNLLTLFYLSLKFIKFIYSNLKEINFADSRSEISFSVGLSHHFRGTSLIFDRVFSNRGGGYSPTTGHFTAKESGVYVFHFHALSRSDAVVLVDLYHNYHYIDSLFGGSDEEFATGSNAATLNLVAGDTVFLKSKRSTNSYYGTPDQVYCTFSGYRLDLLEELPIVDPGVIIG